MQNIYKILNKKEVCINEPFKNDKEQSNAMNEIESLQLVFYF